MPGKANPKSTCPAAPIDPAFIQAIEQWRDRLAHNFALRNDGLSECDLNFAVQRTIDRVIFLRMCEDRGIEPFGQIEALCNGPSIYARLGELFRRAADKYDSSLFCLAAAAGREPLDDFTLALKLDDEILEGILRGLYRPDCPYEFSALPAETLGHVYEQFLGKVIRLTEGRRALVEDRPEVKKAGGVYYTPTHIVDYIVENTIGKLLEGKSPKDIDSIRPLRILDPACGSGAFLLGAYQYLIDWHRDWYVAEMQRTDQSRTDQSSADRSCADRSRDREGADKKKSPIGDRIYQGADGEWRLTVREKKRILLNNIYGVDIDFEAVEVSKRSLLLKMFDGESAETIGQELESFPKRVLQDLAGNIKCGNALIGPDFHGNGQIHRLDEEERYRINVFDWQAEFSEVFNPSPERKRRVDQSPKRRCGVIASTGDKAFACAPGSDPDGGFDAVIGNPPWGQKEIDKNDQVARYYRDRYESLAGIFDLFRPFVERGVRLLGRGGMFGMVLPDIVLLKDYASTRRFLLEKLGLTRIDWWGMPFRGAVMDAATIIGRRESPSASNRIEATLRDEEKPTSHFIDQADFWNNDRYAFNLHLTTPRRRLLQKLASYPSLGLHFEVHEGVHSGNIREELFVDARLDDSCRPLVFGRGEIAPFLLKWEGRYVRLSALPDKRTQERYANAGRPDWYSRPKLLVRRTGDRVLAAVDLEHRYASNNFFVVFPSGNCPIDLHGLSALLNTKFMTWYFRLVEPRKGRVFAELKIKHLSRFPLPILKDSMDACSRLNRLGGERIRLVACVDDSSSPSSVERTERGCRSLDEQIEHFVREAFDMPIDLH